MAFTIDHTDDVRGVIVGGDSRLIKYEFWTTEPYPFDKNRLIEKIYLEQVDDVAAQERFFTLYPWFKNVKIEMRVFDNS